MAGVRRTFLHPFANAGAQTDPGDAKMDLGWIEEKPPYQFFNYILRRIDEMLAHIEEHGIADWHVTTPYPAGGLAMGSDDLVYRSVQANTGNDPTADGGTNWLLLTPGATDFAAGLIELATISEVSLGINNSKAVTPAGLASRLGAEGIAGLLALASDAEVANLLHPSKAITPRALGTLDASTTQRGIVELADAAETLAGTDAGRAVTPQSLGALASSLAATGYQTFPGGLTLQWGTTLINNTFDVDITLPVAFPNAFLKAFASSYFGNNSESQNAAGAEPNGLTQVRLASAQVNRNVHWLALGH